MGDEVFPCGSTTIRRDVKTGERKKELVKE
jgi:hypothetical protein